MFQKLMELLERFVAAFEKDVEHKISSRGKLAAAGERLGALTEELGEELKEDTPPKLVAPTDRDVLKADLDAGEVEYSSRAQTPTLQKLWLEMKEKGAPADGPEVLTGLVPDKKYTAEQVRAKSIECAGLFDKERIQGIFTHFGASKFTEIPEEKYPEVMAALGALK